MQEIPLLAKNIFPIIEILVFIKVELNHTNYLLGCDKEVFIYSCLLYS
jgi:hypothetical protein